MDEKRRCHRLNISLPASFKTSKHASSLSIGKTLDISAIGLCLTSKQKLAVGQELPLNVTLPTDEKLTIHVKVIWVNEACDVPGEECRIGVKIVEPLKADESKFVKYFAQKFQQFFKNK